MVKLDDIMDTHLLADMLAEGYVRRGDHPTLPLSIYNYTAKAQYDQEWNDVTEQCRGLIVHHDGTVVARPFRKFFNLSQLRDEDIPQEPFRVYDKMDGSLGVLYPTNDEHYAIATRGSFVSDQAIKATAIYKARYKDEFNEFDNRGLTYLFEIIYPGNRIVVDYGEREDIVLLDIIDIETGESVLEDYAHRWPGEVVESFDGINEVSDLITLGQPSNAEGFVLKFDSGMRVKVKHDEYTRLHRVLTNVTARRLFEIAVRDDLQKKGYTNKQIAYVIGLDPEMVAGIPAFQEILDRVPDEFYAWVKQVEERLETQYREIAVAVSLDFDKATKYAQQMTVAIPDELDQREYRKQFAVYANMSKYSDILFRMLAEQDVSGMIWKRIRPEHEKPFFQQSEDVA